MGHVSPSTPESRAKNTTNARAARWVTKAEKMGQPLTKQEATDLITAGRQFPYTGNGAKLPVGDIDYSLHRLNIPEVIVKPRLDYETWRCIVTCQWCGLTHHYFMGTDDLPHPGIRFSKCMAPGSPREVSLVIDPRVA
jgi:hypothetical protein